MTRIHIRKFPALDIPECQMRSAV